MFKQVLVACCVLYSVQVLSGPIKSTPSPECQALQQELELKSFIIKQNIVIRESSQNVLEKTAQKEVKESLNTLKSCIKAEKGSPCSMFAGIQQKYLENKAKDMKQCKTKLSLKELKQYVYPALKDIAGHASSIDQYCGFFCKDPESLRTCVADSTEECRAQMNSLESVINKTLDAQEQEVNSCYHDTCEHVKTESDRILAELNACVQPAKDENTSSASSSSESNGSENKEESKGTTTPADDKDNDNTGGEDNGDSETTPAEGGNDREDNKVSKGDAEASTTASNADKDAEENEATVVNDSPTESNSEDETTTKVDHDQEKWYFPDKVGENAGTEGGDAGNDNKEENQEPGTNVEEGNGGKDEEAPAPGNDDNKNEDGSNGNEVPAEDNGNGNTAPVEENGNGNEEPAEETPIGNEAPAEENGNGNEAPAEGENKVPEGNNDVGDEGKKDDNTIDEKPSNEDYNTGKQHADGEQDEINIEY